MGMSLTYSLFRESMILSLWAGMLIVNVGWFFVIIPIRFLGHHSPREGDQTLRTGGIIYGWIRTSNSR